MTPPFLGIESIAKIYGPIQALAGVSFTVEEGELFGLLGPNGAGKSTLMSILSCLMDPDAGSATLIGRRLGTRERELKRLIGLVPQELAIYSELTARENLRFFGELYGVKDPILRQRTEETLTAIGLTERADDRAGTFSGGMKRRLNLGASLIHQPKLLLLDEPTTGVDPQSRHHIFEEVRRLNRAGVTIIYTSHYMEEVQALCSRVGIIDLGKLIACDDLEVLLRRLEGLIRLRFARPTPELRSRLSHLNGVKVREIEPLLYDLEAADIQAVLPQLMRIMADLRVDLSNLEIQEPNLERVFLHLTGRTLRD